MKKIVSIACLFAAAALLAGCPKKATTVEPPSAGRQVPGAGGSDERSEGGSTSTSPLGGDAGTQGGGPGGGPNASVGRIIYFDFDKSDIRPEFAGGRSRATRSSSRRIPARSSSSRATPTSAARASTTSVWASGARRPCGAR